MQKFIYFIVGIVVFTGLVVTTVSAQSTATVYVNSASSEFIYYRDFDRLGLDFNIAGQVGDVLNTVTVSASGTARAGLEYDTLKLWTDFTNPGFEGWGFDQELATASNVSGAWVFENINFTFTQSSHRFFVSFESGNTVQAKILQLLIDQGSDLNGDGNWQSGEKGVYLSSGVVSTITGSLYSNTSTFKTSKIDGNAPKGYIESLIPTAPTTFVDPTLPVTISGNARDRNGGNVYVVELLIDGTPHTASATVATTTTWTYEYTPTDLYEDLQVSLRLTDGNTNVWTSPAYQFVIDQRAMDVDQSSFTTDKPSITADGLDGAVLTLTARDENGTPLPNRELSFSTDRAVDLLSATSFTTNDQGVIRVTLMSTATGTATVTASYRNAPFKTINIEVVEGAEPVEPPTLPGLGDLKAGDLIKASLDGVYYLDANGVRHVFVFFPIYESWYGDDFSNVITVSDETLAQIPLGSPVTYRPGSMLTSPSINEVYLVAQNMTLRHISSEAIAIELFGSTWNTQVHDLPESLLFGYFFGNAINVATDVDMTAIQSSTVTIDSELAL